MKEPKRYPCPCCGFLTLNEEPPGTYAICKVCFWEDDYVQFNDPDFKGGANELSLRESRANFLSRGVSDLRFADHVRAPTDDEKPGTD